MINNISKIKLHRKQNIFFLILFAFILIGCGNKIKNNQEKENYPEPKSEVTVIEDKIKDSLVLEKRKDTACFQKSNKEYKIACPDLYDPVCGCDGVNYSNECEAKRAGVKKWTKGRCK